MTFEIPSMLPLLVIFGTVAVLAAITVVAATVDVIRRNRPVRLARHESIPSYYGHLVLGH